MVARRDGVTCVRACAGSTRLSHPSQAPAEPAPLHTSRESMETTLTIVPPASGLLHVLVGVWRATPLDASRARVQWFCAIDGQQHISVSDPTHDENHHASHDRATLHPRSARRSGRPRAPSHCSGGADVDGGRGGDGTTGPPWRASERAQRQEQAGREINGLGCDLPEFRAAGLMVAGLMVAPSAPFGWVEYIRAGDDVARRAAKRCVENHLAGCRTTCFDVVGLRSKRIMTRATGRARGDLDSVASTG